MCKVTKCCHAEVKPDKEGLIYTFCPECNEKCYELITECEWCGDIIKEGKIVIFEKTHFESDCYEQFLEHIQGETCEII